MLARRLRWLLGLECAAYATLLHAASRQTLAWPAALAIVMIGHLTLRCAVVPLGVVIAWSVDSGLRARPLRPAAALRAFVGECAAMWWNYVLAPFEPWLRPPAPASAPDDATPEVVLVHGILCNRVVWRPFSSALARLGIATRAVNLEPLLGSLDAMADALAAALEGRACRPALLVAHSMGGLVVRRLLQRRPDLRLAGVVTIATPHHGAAQAAFLPAPAARAMRRGSAWLAMLERGAPPPPQLPRLAIRSVHDELVSPADSARWNGARELVVDAVGHVALLADARVIAAVVAQIRALAPRAATPPAGATIDPSAACEVQG